MRLSLLNGNARSQLMDKGKKNIKKNNSYKYCKMIINQPLIVINEHSQPSTPLLLQNNVFHLVAWQRCYGSFAKFPLMFLLNQYINNYDYSNSHALTVSFEFWVSGEYWTIFIRILSSLVTISLAFNISNAPRYFCCFQSSVVKSLILFSYYSYTKRRVQKWRHRQSACKVKLWWRQDNKTDNRR